MERAEYDKLDQTEDRMWWFAATHANLLLLHRMAVHDSGVSGVGAPLLDAGCGTGGLLTRIAAAYPRRPVIGLDADDTACARAASKSAQPVCAGSVNALPFADRAFGTIFSADVLCHRDVDERAALGQFYRCLRDDGLLILNLPAYRWMLSRHDSAVYNARRYSRRGLVRLLQTAGFRLLFASYWNVVLFPIMVLTRKLLPGGPAPTSDVRLYPAPVEALCRAATALERRLLGLGIRFPFGGSLIAVATKDAGRGAAHA
ncbi:MAG TPA: class I SAM-dependent methyltransferase [Stellaceae bacterium]|jgi:SAM-dependent methyltransferase|nr:class I SAM-dependent methyltransferase [Stellaceae bacterium]